jgi:hypothetical protein
MFIIDIFFTFFTAYQHEKKYVTVIWRIALNYLKGYLIVDCITNIPMLATSYRI